MSFPVLSIITFIPLVAALIILMLPAHRKNETRAVALAAATFALILSAWVYFSYDQAAAGYQFIERYDWLPALGISLYFGVDGMSTPLVLLTGVVMFTGVLISWGDDDKHVMAGIQDRPREFFAFLFILAWGVFGVFVSLDLFMLFFFYEIAVFPMYLLIAIWGWAVTREYAAMKLTLYLFLGSVISLVGVLAMYFAQYQNTGVLSFDMLQMESADFSQTFQNIWYLPVFLGFAVLGGIWPFHNWSPDGHVAAPTAVSMFHAGVLMKLGAFAALRVGIMLLPEGAKYWQWLIMFFAGVAVVYGAYIAFVQTDFKYMVGFSSVSHMGL
ncbi:MAG: NADH-quinone oxidoreductase subunit M, partial [Chloroflexota bacterium]|nr:NADH-quinone oxidoreductase subunit M [Chloroflexota bacterium]